MDKQLEIDTELEDVNEIRINEKIDNRKSNNFDLIRFVAALLVIISHCYSVLGYGEFQPIVGNMTLGTLGVFTFFTISGFLIAKSWDRDPSLFHYFWKRFLRIMPGFFVMTLVTIFVIGPLFTSLPLNEYFTDLRTWGYLKANTFFLHGGAHLPGVFANNPLPTMVNGPIWTLKYEIIFYIFIGISGFIIFFHKKEVIFILYLVAIALYSYYFYNPENTRMFSTYNVLYEFLTLSIYFLAGVFLYISRDIIKYDYKISILFLAILFILAVLDINNIFCVFTYACFLLLPYLVISFALIPCKKLNNFGKYGDFSYGMYIYAFPIQQIIVYFYRELPVELMILFSIIFTIALGYLSWHFIESKALKYKNYFKENNK